MARSFGRYDARVAHEGEYDIADTRNGSLLHRLDVVFVGMIQRIMSNGGMPQIRHLARALVYQALVAP